MDPFKNFTGKVLPLNREDVDTDQIIPKQFLKRIERTGFGQFLFFDWCFEPDGKPKEDFILNWPAYQNCEILLVGGNFGCGSSREHAPWAIQQAGFRVIISPSYADIFYNNCFKNGLLPIRMEREPFDFLMTESEGKEGYRLSIDLEAQTVTVADNTSYKFEIDSFQKQCLLEGLDDIALTFQYEPKIAAYEKVHPIF